MKGDRDRGEETRCSRQRCRDSGATAGGCALPPARGSEEEEDGEEEEERKEDEEGEEEGQVRKKGTAQGAAVLCHPAAPRSRSPWVCTATFGTCSSSPPPPGAARGELAGKLRDAP